MRGMRWAIYCGPSKRESSEPYDLFINRKCYSKTGWGLRALCASGPTRWTASLRTLMRAINAKLTPLEFSPFWFFMLFQFAISFSVVYTASRRYSCVCQDDCVGRLSPSPPRIVTWGGRPRQRRGLQQLAGRA